MRWDSSTRKSSPELWPRLSFMCLKRSTSMKSTASKPAHPAEPADRAARGGRPAAPGWAGP